ncbi:MAG: biotin--[acetyl-CoA-carboxylase] ligase [Gammaproteobacteria bacterium]|nr:biotin--[acetyl-CoA-carboxylase] ligase [Gammaproteobacteria bacterium]
MLHFTEVLSLLDNNQYYSGQALAKRFNVTRATIHNCIVKIESLGIAIERVRGLGYRLAHPLDLLNRSEILKKVSIESRDELKDIHCLQKVDSTNQFAAELGLPQEGRFSVVLSEMQSAGKGRRGRHWVSPYAANIYMSVLWPLQRPLNETGMLSPLLAIGMLNALNSLDVAGLGLKWPNDIYCNGKKLAGLLVECSGEISGGCKMVVGMGVNIYMSQVEGVQIDQQWTDIRSETPQWQFSRNDVAAELINHCYDSLVQFEKDSYNRLNDDWSRWDILKDKRVDLHTANFVQSGMSRGIDNDGCLLLETSKGVEKFSAGDVSLRASK